MQIHQILVSANPGDAITDTAFEIRELLRQVGPSEIYARFAHPKLQKEVKELREFSTRRTTTMGRDLIVFHASIGEPEVTEFVGHRPERLVVMYHNISPPDRFLEFDPRKAGLLASGRREVASLADKALTALTFSQYNASELVDMGFRNVSVMPLIVDINRLSHIEPYEPTMNHFRNIEGPVVLFVGQLLPHKRPDLLVQAYHVLTTYLMPDAWLAMVGNQLLPKFADHIANEINELNLNRAWMTGPVDAETLVAMYRNADLFVTMSEHEGFCVPLLEAMGFDVPVLARNVAAIPETVGDAGVLLPEDASLELVAETMKEMLTNQPLRDELIKKGRHRIGGFDPDLARAEILNNILAVAAS
jgi:glycosyltransferase involved in cell wall biosynthesis